ncbi:MAG: rhombosortase [Lysobacterales bacterium]
MNKPTPPFLTSGLILVLIGIHFLVPDKSAFYFTAENIAQGELWRLVTGHLVHADLQHLGWNCLGLLVLGTLIEQYSKAAWWAAIIAGIASVDVLLFSPFSQLYYYCGLSGVLNTLLVVVLWLEWRRTRSWLVIAITLGAVAKAVIEVASGESLLTHINWPPYAWSHVAGLIGGVLVILTHRKTRYLLHHGNENPDPAILTPGIGSLAD